MLYQVFIVLFCMVMSFGAYAQEREVPKTQSHVQLSFSPIVKKVAPAVVNIYTKRLVSTGFRSPFMNDPFFREFFGGDVFGGRMRKHIESALGSGVIVSKKGLVVTNAHVVKGAQEISIVLADGEEYSAELVLKDIASDLALLKVNTDDVEFPFVRLKPSETLEVGDLVLAIGNPFGMGQTVTSGIVSAQGHSTLNINDFNFFIQTDAAINPGNSGGPLVSMDGGVVGINTAIYSRSGGSMGLGFAVPSEMVASVIAAHLNGQTGDRGIIRPWLGVQVQDVTADIAASLDMGKPRGALIAGLHKASPLKEAGVEVGDVVIAVNEYTLRDSAELKFRMAMVPIGKAASVTLFRAGAKKTLDIKTIAPPEIPPRNEIVLEGNHILKGAVVGNINPAVELELGLIGDEHGVVVMEMPRRSYAVRAVNRGDILLEINGAEVKEPKDVDRLLLAGLGKDVVQILLKRDGQVVRMYLR